MLTGLSSPGKASAKTTIVTTAFRVHRPPAQFAEPAISAREHQRALDFLDRLGHLDAPRAGFRAVERRPAAPHPVDLVEDLQSFGGGLVSAVEDEPVRVDDRRGAEVVAFVPVDRAA